MGIKIVEIVIAQEDWCKIIERDCVELMKLSKGETVLSCSPPVIKEGNVTFTLEVDDPTFETTISVEVGKYCGCDKWPFKVIQLDQKHNCLVCGLPLALYPKENVYTIRAVDQTEKKI